MNKLAEKLLKELEAKDLAAIELSDSLDVKASIILLLATFLVTETAYLMDKHPSGAAFWFGVGASLAEIASLIAATVALWPRTYVYPDPESTSSRLFELETVFQEYEGQTASPEEVESSVLDRLTLDQIGWCRSRIENNQQKNRVKSSWLNTSFYAASLALLLSLGTLVVLSHLFSGIHQ